MKTSSWPTLLERASFVTPLAASLAANVTWGVWTGSAILVVAGVLSPLLLVLAIERWRWLPALTRYSFKWWARTGAMTGAVLAVGGWSWLHTTLVLMGELPPAPNKLVHTIEIALCIAAVLPVDGLAVLSILAMSKPADDAAPEDVERPGQQPTVPLHLVPLPKPTRADDGLRGRPRPTSARSTPRPETPKPPRDTIPSRPAKPKTPGEWDDAQIVAALTSRDRVPGIGSIRQEFGIGATRAGRVQKLVGAAKAS